MRLTAFTDYSLRVLVHVATAPGGRTTIAEIARAYGISEHHLVKVVHLLGRQGFLSNVRGRGGGLRLAAAPASIRIGAVVRAAEASEALVECVDGKGRACAIAGCCKLAGVLDEALQAFHRTLDSYTLEDLVATRQRPQLVAKLHPLAVAL